jgi:two-component system response regulator PilR (NtrC family)
MHRILIVDDEPNLRQVLEMYFTQKGYEVIQASSGAEALKVFGAGEGFHLVICDIKMPDLDGLQVLAELKKRAEHVPVIMVTAFGSHLGALDALRHGASDYIAKPFELEELAFRAGKAIEKLALEKQVYELREEAAGRAKYGFVIGKSAVMQKVGHLVERVAQSTATVLVSGESGTGKELVARAVHDLGPRKRAPFVSINCGAIPETLLESELFGYEKGAFTGAVRNAPGLFLEADKGTVFLDEIGEMSLGMQVKLLRVLQDRRVRPVGATRDFEVDVRVIAATNQDLQALVADKRFREDLYYRINVIHLALPPLRERKEDIPLLVQHFLAKYCAAQKIPLKKISMDALRILENYAWPGNVRELENVIERAVALEPGGVVRLSSLPGHLASLPLPALPAADLPEEGMDLGRHLDSIARHLILQALERTDGNQTQAAKLLKMSFRSFRYYVKKYKIKDLVHPGRAAD